MQAIANYRDSNESLQNKFDNLFFPYFWDNKKNREVYNWINNDNGSIVVSGSTFWIEKSYSGSDYPNAKAFDSIKRFCKKLGFTYLYQ